MTFSFHAAKKLSRGAVIVMTAVALAGPALAAKGGNGNGRGNSANAQNAEKGNNGRGAIASELKGLNAAHANINGLMNANPDSRVGQIYAFQQATLGAEAAGAEAEALFVQIQETWGEEINADYEVAKGINELLVSLCENGSELDLAPILAEDPDACVNAPIEKERLEGLTEQQIVEEFGDYEDTEFASAMEEYFGYGATQEEQQLLADETLLEMTGGEELSEDALNEFLRLLGLLEE
jgi:hypothetical protein